MRVLIRHAFMLRALFRSLHVVLANLRRSTNVLDNEREGERENERSHPLCVHVCVSASACVCDLSNTHL